MRSEGKHQSNDSHSPVVVFSPFHSAFRLALSVNLRDLSQIALTLLDQAVSGFRSFFESPA
jgi:hypothetical protein